MKKSKKIKRVAFTLLELLISSSILSILIGSAWFSFSSIQRAANFSNNRFEFLKNVTIISGELKKLIQEASPYKQQNKKAFFKGTTSKLRFTTTHSKGRLKPQQLIEISNEIKGLTIKYDGIGWLFRKNKGLLISSEDKNSLKNQLGNRVYQSKLAKISFQYGDGNDEHWKKEWNVQKTGRLPFVVEVTLTFEKNSKSKTPPLIVKQLIQTRRKKDSKVL